VHADDVSAPTLLEECLAPLEADDSLVLAYASGEIYLDEDGNKHRHEDLRDFRLLSEAPSERFEKFLRQFYPVNGSTEQLFGVIRMSTLRECTLLRAYSSADIMFCGELALRGKWERIDKPLFFYRYHSGQSIQIQTREDRINWWDPTLGGDMKIVVWRWLLDYVSRIMDVPMSRAERLRCVRALHRGFVRHLYSDLAIEPLAWAKNTMLTALQRVTQPRRREKQVGVG
jgi:hypothetical protein